MEKTLWTVGCTMCFEQFSDGRYVAKKTCQNKIKTNQSHNRYGRHKIAILFGPSNRIVPCQRAKCAARKCLSSPPIIFPFSKLVSLLQFYLSQLLVPITMEAELEKVATFAYKFGPKSATRFECIRFQLV